jgi:hypothetical protein
MIIIKSTRRIEIIAKYLIKTPFLVMKGRKLPYHLFLFCIPAAFISSHMLFMIGAIPFIVCTGIIFCINTSTAITFCH